ncbi:hypothetical protein, partial [Stenotrophomonas maltophilia]|uniref:hypothetical protein n=1 Tax=Stenotrophomonas maltophilia TaxID=40324 RepID=UPI001955690F
PWGLGRGIHAADTPAQPTRAALDDFRAVHHGINRKSRERKAEKPRQCRGFSCSAESTLGCR